LKADICHCGRTKYSGKSTLADFALGSDLCTEDSGICHRKLAGYIYAALHFPESNPAVVAAWDENQLIITNLTQNVSSETIRPIFVKLAIAP
jgi:hypothetical protein